LAIKTASVLGKDGRTLDTSYYIKKLSRLADGQWLIFFAAFFFFFQTAGRTPQLKKKEICSNPGFIQQGYKVQMKLYFSVPFSRSISAAAELQWFVYSAKTKKNDFHSFCPMFI